MLNKIAAVSVLMEFIFYQGDERINKHVLYYRLNTFVKLIESELESN